MTVATQPRAIPLVLPAGDGERIWIAGDTVRITATSEETAGAFTMLEVLVSPGSGPPLHIHEAEDEAFYVLDGEFEFVVDGEVSRVGAGGFVLVPRQTAHAWHNAGDAPARLLVMFTPGGLEGFFREAGQVAGDDGPAPPVDAAEIARTEAAGRRYGLRVVDWSR